LWREIGGAGHRCNACGHQSVEAQAVGVNRGAYLRGEVFLRRLKFNPPAFQKARATMAQIEARYLFGGRR
jgi:hypothetical protein